MVEFVHTYLAPLPPPPYKARRSCRNSKPYQTRKPHLLELQAIDLESVEHGESGVGVLVQDTDLSYRPRVTYTIWREEGAGWWEVRCRYRGRDPIIPPSDCGAQLVP